MKLQNVTTTADGHYAATFLADDLADLIHLLNAAGGTTLTDTLKRLETTMATAAQKLAELEEAIDAFDAREQAEDAADALTKAEVTRLQGELAALQADLDAGKLTPEMEARMDALIERIKASNVIPDEVLPSEG